VSIGQTGSGKTLGFILPCIAHIKAQPVRRKGEGPIALVILALDFSLKNLLFFLLSIRIRVLRMIDFEMISLTTVTNFLNLIVNSPLKIKVVAPTRELAQQIQEVADKFGRLCGVRSTCLFGGVSKNPQIMDIRRGVDLVIATPGNWL